MNGIKLLLDSARGVFIPRDFVHGFKIYGQCETIGTDYFEGVTEWAFNGCNAGPDSDMYWDAWEQILDNATYTDAKGLSWRLYQDGDLFAICEELLTDEEKESFGFGE